MPPIKKVSLCQQIIDELICMIESDTFPPGSWMPSETLLAAQFKVSRNVLRESMKILENYGILRAINGRGTIVTALALSNIQSMRFFESLRNNSSVQQILETRLIIEPQIAYHAALHCTSDDISSLSEVISSDRSQYIPKHGIDDYDFHQKIAEICGNTILINLLNSLLSRLRESEYSRFSQYIDDIVQDQTYQDHSAILQYMQQHDANAAREKMAQHLQDRIRIIQELYRPDITLDAIKAGTIPLHLSNPPLHP